MKKIISLFTLSFVLSLSVFAGDGITPIGGSKTCPQGQTTCLVSQQPTESEEDVYTKIFKIISEIFG